MTAGYRATPQSIRWAADAAGGLPVSDAGNLDLDGRLDVAVSSRLAPTVASRTLDVTAAGEAGIDLDNTTGTLAAAQIASNAFTAAKFAAALGSAVMPPRTPSLKLTSVMSIISGRMIELFADAITHWTTT